MYFYGFCKIFQNIFWQITSEWLLLVFICEFWVFKNTTFTEHLWETPYFMYKSQNFNQQIQQKTISQVFYTSILHKNQKKPFEGVHILKIHENYLWKS